MGITPGNDPSIGDRALFERFRGLILRPLLSLVTVSLLLVDLKGLKDYPGVFFWGSGMGDDKTYVYCSRIYDAKNGSFVAQ